MAEKNVPKELANKKKYWDNIHNSKCVYLHYKQFYVHLSSLIEEEIIKKKKLKNCLYFYNINPI